MADRRFEQANADSRREIEAFAASLPDMVFGREIGDGWTVGTIFGHIAFWEGYVVERWRHAQTHGLPTPIALPEELPDFINNSSAPLWRAIPGREAVARALAAADAANALIAGLPDSSLDAAFAEGKPRLVDRSLHRRDHIEQIRRAL